MIVELEYGRGQLPVRIPEGCEVTVLRKKPLPVIGDAARAEGMVTPINVLEPGANLIIASECSEGIGSPQYREAQRRLVADGPDGFLAGIHLYSQGLPAEDRALTGVNVVDSIEDAIARSVESSGDRAVAVIPEGPYVAPRFAAPAA